MLTILGASAVGLYEFSRRSLYDQLDQRLEILAQAASHSLLAIRENYDQQQTNGRTRKEIYEEEIFSMLQ